jgi:hypothetical protein
MHLVKPVRRTLLILAMSVACATSAVPSAQASTGTLGHSGRFYTVNGTPAILIGMDMQELAANPAINYTAMLDALQSHNVNAIRLWIYPAWSPTTFLEPWTYGVCASGKYDLDTWNTAYWTRLKAVVDAAAARNIYVELSLFPSNYVDDSSFTNTTTRPAWNSSFNCNGQFAPNPAGSFVTDFWNPVTTSATYIRQKQLVDKVLATFPYASYPSVSFEIANEFPGVNTDAYPSGTNTQATNANLPLWQNGWINYIKANAAGRIVSAHAQDWTGTNTNGISSYWAQANVDILNFHVGAGDGVAVAGMIDPNGAQRKNKIIQDNETTTNQHGASLDLATQRAWAWNINLGYFKWYWDDSSTGATDPEFLAALGRLQVMYNIDTQVDWTDISDVHNADVVQSGAASYRLLSSHGDRRYLYYGWGTNLNQPLKLTMVAGSYTYTWTNPQNGAVLASGTATSTGGTVTFTQPSGWNTTAGIAFTAVP